MAKDRLSNLPDDLICHILSFLPTKDAYITSVLSTRWISLCTKVPDLHFKIPSSRNWSRKRSYSECIDSNSIHSICAGVRRRTEKIRKLTLHSNDCEPYAIAIQKWVTKALDLGVKELDLHLHFVLYRTIFLPRKLSTLESLVVLKLQGQIQPSLTSISYLPSLKILNLEVTYWRNTENVSENYLSTFLSGCPRLEELQIRGLLRFPLEISLHFLKRLCLHLGFSPTMCYLPALILNVPSIETLDMHDHSHHIYEVVNLFNVDRATLNISKPLTINARLYLYQLMEGLSNVKSLYIDLCTTVLFLKTKNSIYYLSHLQFHNLLCLRVQIPLDCNWDVLVAFLQNSPNLEVLIIEKYFERTSKRSEVTNSSWTKPTRIPTCLLTSFKVLEFRGNPYYKIELDFKKYIIENSAKLEKVILSTKERLYYEWKEELKDFDQEELYLSSCRCSS